MRNGIFRRILNIGLVLAVGILLAGAVSATDIYAAQTSTTDAATVSTGLVVVNGVTYYYYEDGTLARSKFITIGKKTYYFNKDGVMLTGLRNINKKYYYFGTDGVMQTGFVTIDKNTYYFDTDDSSKGQAAIGLTKIKKKYYYFSKKGVMQTGWKTIKKKTYYFTKKGDEKGQAAVGIKNISGKTYYFDKKGVLDEAATSKMDSMDKKVANMESDTKYKILVNKSTHTVAIYKGTSKHWKRIKTFTCTIGASATPTVEGTFSMGPNSGRAFHLYYFDAEGGVRAFYASRITGGTLFHSTLYYPNGNSPQTASTANATLGSNLSHGCIRLYWKSAKWIYDNIPEGTSVTIYK